MGVQCVRRGHVVSILQVHIDAIASQDSVTILQARLAMVRCSADYDIRMR